MRALIVRLGSIGDIVHAMPLVGAIRAHLPGAEIDWVVEAGLAGVVGMCPGVSQVIRMRSRQSGADEGWWPTLRRLRARRYDVAFDAQGLIKSAAVARLSGAARVVGWSRGFLRESAAALFYSECVEATGAVHVIDKNMALLRAVGLHEPGREVVLNAGGESALVNEVADRLGGRFAMINPGANWPNKRWPPDRFGELAARIRAEHGLASVVSWGPGDDDLADAVVAASRGAAARAPKSSLADLVHLARRATVVVSGDTGPFHLACAAGARMVGIFGPTDPRRNGSWRPADVHVSRFEACACHHLRSCRARAWCLADVTVDQVEVAVAKRLATV